MRHKMAVSFVLFPLFFYHTSFAETNLSLETNTSLIRVQKQNISPTFSGTYWQLVELFDGVIDAEKMHRETYMHFSPLLNTHGKFKGGTGCNDLLGKYDAHYFQLSFDVDHIAMTRLACPESNIENDFLEALKQTKAWRIKEDTLLFLDANQSTVARFKAQSKK